MQKDLLAKHVGEFKNYTELRAQINTQQAITLVNGNILNNTKSTNGGVCSRVYKNGVFGFSSSAEYNDESIAACIAAAERNAIFLDSKANRGKPALPTVPQGFMNKVGADRDISQKCLIDRAKEIDEYIKSKYPDLLSRYVVSGMLNIEKLAYVSDSYGIHSFVPRSHIYIGMTVNDKMGNPIELYASEGAHSLFDESFTDNEKLFGKVDQLYERVRQKAEGVYADAGVCDCVLSPMLSGMVSHEAVGHTVEADLVLGGSVAGHCLEKRVASDKVTMIDFANTYEGKELPIPVYVDDEGTLARDALLIDRGILKGYMHDKASALHFGVEPTGNARAFAYSDEPLVRMRNTLIMPGEDKLEDMIASIDKGYYLIDTNNGQADTTGEFMFGVCFGYEIKNGKLGKAIKDTTMSGVAFDMLKTVDMVSSNMEMSFTGYCGKKQMIPVTMGGPSIKCKMNIGGR